MCYGECDSSCMDAIRFLLQGRRSEAIKILREGGYDFEHEGITEVDGE